MRVASQFVSVLLTPLIAVLPLAAQTSPDTTAPTGALQIAVVGRDALVLAPGSRAQKGYTVQVTDSNGKPVAGAAVVCRLPDAAPTGTFGDGTHSTVLFTGPDGRAHISGIRWGAASGTVVFRVTAASGTAHAGTLVEQKLATEAATTVGRIDNPRRVGNPPKIPPVMIIHRDVPRQEAATIARPRASETSASDQIPQVSVTSPPPNAKIGHSSKKKWIIIAILAGAAAGAAGFAARGKSSSSSGPSTPSLSIGTPTISVGHP